jgi:hypothetical protein
MKHAGLTQTAMNRVDKTIGRILDETGGKSVPPDPAKDLSFCRLAIDHDWTIEEATWEWGYALRFRDDEPPCNAG